MSFKIVGLIIGTASLALSADINFTQLDFSYRYLSEDPVSLKESYAMGIGDIDNNGYPDVIAEYTDGEIILLHFHEDMKYDMETIGYGANKNYGWYPRIPVVIEDFNGDHQKDFVVDRYLFVNSGPRSYRQINLPDSAGMVQCAFDAEGDGDADLLCYDKGWERLLLLVNDGEGYFTFTEIDWQIDLFYTNVPITSDWDGDGDTDIFCYDNKRGENTFVVYRNDGACNFTRLDIMGSLNVWGYLPVDLDADGDFEIAMTNSEYSSVLQLYEESGTFYNPVQPTFEILSRQNRFWYAIDIDHDGVEDIYPDAGKCWIKENSEHSLELHSFFVNGIAEQNGRNIQTMPYDFDNDGDIDFMSVVKTGEWLSSDLSPEIDMPDNNGAVVAGLNDTIRWKSSYEGDMRITCTLDAEKTWQVAADGIPNTGMFIWKVPRTLSDSCRLAVADARTGELRDTSDGFFSIVRGKFVIDSPADGDTLIIGDSCTVSWTTIGDAGSDVIIRYEPILEGQASKPVERHVRNNGCNVWEIEGIAPGAGILSIRSVSEPVVTTMNTVNVTVLPAPAITVIAPNGGERLYGSPPLRLQWDATSSVSLLRAYISVDSGNTWGLFADSIRNEGRFSTQVFFPAAYAHCFVKLTDFADESCFDCSDSSFTVMDASVFDAQEDVNEPYVSAFYEGLSGSILVRSQGEVLFPVAVSLYTLSGKKIVSIPSRAYASGTHTVAVKRELPASGLYYLRTVSAHETSVKKIIIGR